MRVVALQGVVHEATAGSVGDDPEALRALGEQARRRLELLPRRFQVIGQRAAVASLLEVFPGPGLPPRLAREQTYLSLEPAQLTAFDRLPELRAARREDYALLYDHFGDRFEQLAGQMAGGADAAGRVGQRAGFGARQAEQISDRRNRH